MTLFYQTWRHKESNAASIAQASLSTAKAGTWKQLDPSMQARQLRMFLILTLQIATLSLDKVNLGDLSAATYGQDDERNAMGSAIARTPILLLPPTIKSPLVASFSTDEGNPPVAMSGEAGEITIVTVLLVTAVAAAVAFIAHEVAAVIDSTSFEEEKTKRLMATQTKSVEVLQNHVEREKLAGKQLPFAEEERSVLQQLQDLQKQIAAERHQPLPSPFNGARQFLDSVTNTASALLPLALGAIAFFALTDNK